MELATGKVRYEFSGPGPAYWFAAFLPDGKAFLASRLFGRSVVRWPTDHVAKEGLAPPKPGPALEGVETSPTSGVVSADGHVAFTSDDGGVLLRRLEGDAPALAPPPGVGPTVVTFTPAGRHLVALRGGRLWAWPLPEPEPAAPASPSAPAPAR